MTRLSLLDRVWDENQPAVSVSEELFEVADSIDSNSALRRALTDYTTPSSVRSQVVNELFGSKLSAAAVTIVAQAAATRWREAGLLADVLDRQGVRSALLVAQGEGELDQLENDLFKLGRIIYADVELATTLDNQSVPLAARESLMAQLVAGKLSEIGRLLARRAVRCRQRKVGLTLEAYQGLAAALRNRAIVKVTAARPLTPEHVARLQAVMTQQLGRPITMQINIDPSVLGGLSVRVGDDAIEGTVAARLRQATELIH